MVIQTPLFEYQGSIPEEQLERIAARVVESDRARSNQDFGRALLDDDAWDEFVEEHDLEFNPTTMSNAQRAEFRGIRNVLMGEGVQRYDRFTRSLLTQPSQAQQQGITIREFVMRGTKQRRFIKDNRFISAANVGRLMRGGLGTRR